jgi:hypothetical protein
MERPEEIGIHIGNANDPMLTASLHGDDPGSLELHGRLPRQNLSHIIGVSVPSVLQTIQPCTTVRPPHLQTTLDRENCVLRGSRIVSLIPPLRKQAWYVMTNVAQEPWVGFWRRMRHTIRVCKQIGS